MTEEFDFGNPIGNPYIHIYIYIYDPGPRVRGVPPSPPGGGRPPLWCGVVWGGGWGGAGQNHSKTIEKKMKHEKTVLRNYGAQARVTDKAPIVHQVFVFV